MVLLTAQIFAGFCVHHTDLGGEGAVAIAAFLLPPAASAPHPNFSLKNSLLTAVGRFAHKFVGNSAHMP